MTKVDISDLLRVTDNQDTPPQTGDRNIPIYNPRVNGRTLEFSLPTPAYSVEAELRRGNLELYIGATGTSTRQVLYPAFLSIPKGTKKVVYKGNLLSSAEISYTGFVEKSAAYYLTSFPDLPAVAAMETSRREARKAAKKEVVDYLRKVVANGGRSAIPSSAYQPDPERCQDKKQFVKVTVQIKDLLKTS